MVPDKGATGESSDSKEELADKFREAYSEKLNIK